MPSFPFVEPRASEADLPPRSFFAQSFPFQLLPSNPPSSNSSPSVHLSSPTLLPPPPQPFQLSSLPLPPSSPSTPTSLYSTPPQPTKDPSNLTKPTLSRTTRLSNSSNVNLLPLRSNNLSLNSSELLKLLSNPSSVYPSTEATSPSRRRTRLWQQEEEVEQRVLDLSSFRPRVLRRLGGRREEGPLPLLLLGMPMRRRRWECCSGLRRRRGRLGWEDKALKVEERRRS